MRILLLAFIMLPTVIYAQLTNGHEFGNPGYDEIELSHYKNDSTANALVLHEEGQNYFEIIDGYVRLITKNYFKIKIFNLISFLGYLDFFLNLIFLSGECRIYSPIMLERTGILYKFKFIFSSSSLSSINLNIKFLIDSVLAKLKADEL